jgi:phosphopantetheinyl transferase
LDIIAEALRGRRDDLAADEKIRADRFATVELARRFIAGRFLVRAVLAKKLAKSPSAICFEYGSNGKPSLASLGGPKFNLSHSGRFAVLALSATDEVGIDVEQLAAVAHCAAISSSILSAGEQRALNIESQEDQAISILRTWTAKEAYLKLTGAGLSVDPRELQIRWRGQRNGIVVRWNDSPLAYVLSVDVGRDAVCTLAFPHANPRLRISKFDPSSDRRLALSTS